MKPALYLRCEGRVLKLSNPDKILYPRCGFRKRDILLYYQTIASTVVPHLRDRAFTLRRFPDGVDSASFYEKNCPSHRPNWIQTGMLGEVRHCLINDAPSLLWAVNLAAIELHTTMGRVTAPGIADFVVFDLDPGEGCGVVESSEVALILREHLARIGLQSWVKTSGKKGLHVFVPLNSGTRFEETHSFARSVAKALERRHADRIVSRMSRELRKGKVFIDWSQNIDFKTTTTVYSLRAEAHPWVSTPVEWSEVARAIRDRNPAENWMRFLPGDVLRRVGQHGDLFLPVLEKKQVLPGISEDENRA